MPRLDRGIQYTAASRLIHNRLGVLDRPVKPGDDSSGGGGRAAPRGSHLRMTEQAAAPDPPQTALTFAEIGTT
ncbi:hypothetical protein DXU04_06970 [Bradyrhizobium diazoefficiens]|nr:ATP-binding cassette transporter [Bradyrhizobium diazoefficiens]KOY09737.1 hypothetical protein AF336_15210 [Bradyrhizobium diazoefficiens]